MPDRILREGIIGSFAINALSQGAEIFYRRLMSVVDDFGRFEAHPQILRARMYPLQLDRYTDVDVERWLAECCKIGAEGQALITCYEVKFKKLLQINNFGQRERYAKYPGPGESAPVAAKSRQKPLEAARASNSHSNTHTNGSSESLPSLKLSVGESVNEAHWPVFLANYPNATQVDDGCRMWISLWDTGEINRENFPEIMAGLERWKTSKLWQTKGMRHSVRKWLIERRWKDHPEQAEEKGAY